MPLSITCCYPSCLFFFFFNKRKNWIEKYKGSCRDSCRHNEPITRIIASWKIEHHTVITNFQFWVLHEHEENIPEDSAPCILHKGLHCLPFLSSAEGGPRASNMPYKCFITNLQLQPSLTWFFLNFIVLYAEPKLGKYMLAHSWTYSGLSELTQQLEEHLRSNIIN